MVITVKIVFFIFVKLDDLRVRYSKCQSVTVVSCRYFRVADNLLIGLVFYLLYTVFCCIGLVLFLFFSPLGHSMESKMLVPGISLFESKQMK
jgi:hypothetical protein